MRTCYQATGRKRSGGGDIVLRRHELLYGLKSHTNTGTVYLYATVGRCVGWIPRDSSPDGDLSTLFACRVRDAFDGSDDFNVMGLRVISESAGKVVRNDDYTTIQLYRLGTPLPLWATNVPPTNSEKEIIMTQATIIQSIIQNNKQSAASAAYLEAGRIGNGQIVKAVKEAAPFMLKGYIDTPLGKLVVANLVQIAIGQLRPQDATANKLARAMVTSAYQDGLGTLDIDGMIAKMLDKVEIKEALSKLAESETK